MIWRWFRDWCEQRAATRELNRLQRDDETSLVMELANPLSLAQSAARAGKLTEAAAHWEEARSRMPNIIYQSPDALEILFALNRHDEAEAWARELLRRSPSKQFSQRSFADVAERRGDYEEAAKRWRRVYFGPEEIEGDVRIGQCFMKLERYAEAEAMFESAARRAPADPEPFVELARLSDVRQDWVTARARWRHIIDRFKLPAGIAREAWAMMELGEIEAAEILLEQAMPNNSRDLEIAITRANLAQRRGDLATACERWEHVRQIKPFFPPGYGEGARYLFLLQRHAEADAVMLDAIERFPSDSWPLRGYCHLAHDRRDWAAAADRWLELRRRFPTDPIAGRMAADALRAAGRQEEADALQRDA